MRDTCKRGHPQTDDNIQFGRDGRQRCLVCIRDRKGITKRKKVGLTPRPDLYGIWAQMRARCNYPKHKFFAYYGGRGISVCDRWCESFAAFAADVGPRPSPRHSLDRKNNDGNYEPGNVRWATDIEQARNKRNSKLSEEAALCIRELRRRGAKGVVLAAAFGVSNSLISKVVLGKYWVATETPHQEATS